MTRCDIHDATHIEVDGTVYPIESKWGVGPGRHLAKPSEGGFGCTIEGGRKVSMWDAGAYFREDPTMDKGVSFHIAPHDLRAVGLVEIYVDGIFRGALYPNDAGDGVRFVSSHVKGGIRWNMSGDNLQSWELVFQSPEEEQDARSRPATS